MKILSDKDYKKLSKESTEDAKSRKSTITKLKREIEDLKLTIEKNAHSVELSRGRADRAWERERSQFETIIDELHRTKDELSDELTNYLDLQTTKSSLETREQIIKAKEDQFDGIAKELAKGAKFAEETRAEGYKKGFADGLADGLREASKITAEDRKMAMQVALVAAASHTPEAATEVVKDMTQKVLSDGLSHPQTTNKRKA